IRSDCIKVLYEIGAIKPELIEDYVDEFVALLKHQDNRLVWGGMTALGTMAHRQSDAIAQHIDTLIDTTENGSVITQDWGIRVLSTICAENAQYAEKIFPFLMDFLNASRPKDVPRHAESILIATTTAHQQKQFQRILAMHKPNLKA